MKVEFAEQYSCVCLVLDGTEEYEDILGYQYLHEATFQDGPETEDECLCIRFPNRPQELYTHSALERSLREKNRGMDWTRGIEC